VCVVGVMHSAHLLLLFLRELSFADSVKKSGATFYRGTAGPYIVRPGGVSLVTALPNKKLFTALVTS
jgi:hypothetical protein